MLNEYIKKIFIYMHICSRIWFSIKKERNPAFCNNMDETGEQYTKWNKWGTEWQILFHTTYVKNLKISAS